MIAPAAPSSISAPNPTHSIAFSLFSAIKNPIIPNMMCIADTAIIIIEYVFALPAQSFSGCIEDEAAEYEVVVLELCSV